MSFVATANPPIPGTELQLAADPWFPAIDLAQARKVCRLDGTVTPERLHHAMQYAIDSVGAELAAWRAGHEAAGHTSLAAMPCRPQGAGLQSVLVQRYLRAVYACAQAELAQAWREIDTTPHSADKGERIRERIETKIDEHRRAMRWAISDLLGIPRSTVELI